MATPIKICTLASLSSGTVLDSVLRFEMWAYRLSNERRIGYFPGVENGIFQDYGRSVTDGMITGQAYVTRAQADLLESMYAASTNEWGFSDGINLWRVAFKICEEAEPWGDKVLYEVEFHIKEKLV
jgi:hypothetical protein